MKKIQGMNWLQNKMVLAALLMVLVAGTAVAGVVALRNGQSGEQDKEESPGYAFQTEEDQQVHEEQLQRPEDDPIEGLLDPEDTGLLQKPDREQDMQDLEQDVEPERPVQSGKVDAIVDGEDTGDVWTGLEDLDSILENEMAEAETLVSGDDAFIYEPGEDTEAVLAPGAALTFQADSTIGWPVFGNILLDYSMDSTIYFPTLEQYKCNPGILIQAEVGQPVEAAVRGQVTVIGADEELGNYIMMDLGGDYSILYGQLEDVTVSIGQIVEVGDVLGVVASPTKYYVVEGPNIYLEMRYQEDPVDPLDYLR